MGPFMNFLLFKKLHNSAFFEFEYFILMCSKEKSEHWFYFEMLTAFK